MLLCLIPLPCPSFHSWPSATSMQSLCRSTRLLLLRAPARGRRRLPPHGPHLLARRVMNRRCLSAVRVYVAAPVKHMVIRRGFPHAVPVRPHAKNKGFEIICDITLTLLTRSTFRLCQYSRPLSLHCFGVNVDGRCMRSPGTGGPRYGCAPQCEKNINVSRFSDHQIAQRTPGFARVWG